MYYDSVMCRRVERSVIAQELYGMVQGFDQSFVIQQAVESFTGKDVTLRLYTDSLNLFESLTAINSTREKGLLIDIVMLFVS